MKPKCSGELGHGYNRDNIVPCSIGALYDKFPLQSFEALNKTNNHSCVTHLPWTNE